VTLPPANRVAAVRASAVRDRVIFPSVLDISIKKSLSSIATFAANGTPCPMSSASCAAAIRHDFGSKSSLSQAETSCYRTGINQDIP